MRVSWFKTIIMHYDLEGLKKLTNKQLLAIAVKYYELGNEVHKEAENDGDDIATVGELVLTHFNAWQ